MPAHIFEQSGRLLGSLPDWHWRWAGPAAVLLCRQSQLLSVTHESLEACRPLQTFVKNLLPAPHAWCLALNQAASLAKPCAGPAGDTVVLEFMQRGQLATGDPSAFPVLFIGSVMQVAYFPAWPHT